MLQCCVRLWCVVQLVADRWKLPQRWHVRHPATTTGSPMVTAVSRPCPARGTLRVALRALESLWSGLLQQPLCAVASAQTLHSLPVGGLVVLLLVMMRLVVVLDRAWLLHSILLRQVVVEWGPPPPTH